MIKVYLNTETAILFYEFNSDISAILNLLVYSFFKLSFICWCMHSISSVLRYFYVLPCSTSCILCWSQVLNFVSEIIIIIIIRLGITRVYNYLDCNQQWAITCLQSPPLDGYIYPRRIRESTFLTNVPPNPGYLPKKQCFCGRWQGFASFEEQHVRKEKYAELVERY
jgi:hypothetical protein